MGGSSSYDRICSASRIAAASIYVYVEVYVCFFYVDLYVWVTYLQITSDKQLDG